MIELTDREILRLVREKPAITNLLHSVRQREIEEEEKEQKKLARQRKDDEIAQKLIGATINDVTVEMHRHGKYADYEPTQIKLFTSKGDFVVCDPYEEAREEKE